MFNLKKNYKKHIAEAEKLRIFHEKMLQIRKVIESCKTEEQINNVMNWVDEILISDITIDFRETSFREWFLFLCIEQKNTFVKSYIY